MWVHFPCYSIAFLLRSERLQWFPWLQQKGLPRASPEREGVGVVQNMWTNVWIKHFDLHTFAWLRCDPLTLKYVLKPSHSHSLLAIDLEAPNLGVLVQVFVFFFHCARFFSTGLLSLVAAAGRFIPLVGLDFGFAAGFLQTSSSTSSDTLTSCSGEAERSSGSVSVGFLFPVFFFFGDALGFLATALVFFLPCFVLLPGFVVFSFVFDPALCSGARGWISSSERASTSCSTMAAATNLWNPNPDIDVVFSEKLYMKNCMMNNSDTQGNSNGNGFQWTKCQSLLCITSNCSTIWMRCNMVQSYASLISSRLQLQALNLVVAAPSPKSSGLSRTGQNESAPTDLWKVAWGPK